MTSAQNIVEVQSLRHCYGERTALDGVSFAVARGSCFGLLGPNGGGKTTLFRILTTMMPPTAGTAVLDGHDVVREPAAVRRRIGVVFQSPSLDVHLTVRENLRHGGRLYGLSGATLETRIVATLDRLRVADRAEDRVKVLSGGLRRRVEIAKSMLHGPALLILDEPSTGLDPRARRELWTQLAEIRARDGVTVLVTTHFMDEADRCDRLVILDQGKVIAEGSPDELKHRIGGSCITVEAAEPAALCERIGGRFECGPSVLDGAVRIESDRARALAAELMDAFGDEIRAITIGRPTLEDVFVHETGRRFDEAEPTEAAT